MAVMTDDLLGSDLLGALDQEDRALVMPHLEEVRLRSGHVIVEPGAIVRHVYFPRDGALVAYLVPMADGETVECTMVGREGVVGSLISDEYLPAYARCCVQYGGDFFRMSIEALEKLRMQSSGIDKVLTRHADCMIAQLLQSIACNARHSIEQRTARWLCTVMNRTGSRAIPLTQAQLGGLLGVGRSYLTRVLARFKASGVLGTQRGAIIIHQPRKLRALSCDCSLLVTDHCDLVMRRV